MYNKAGILEREREKMVEFRANSFSNSFKIAAKINNFSFSLKNYRVSANGETFSSISCLVKALKNNSLIFFSPFLELRKKNSACLSVFSLMVAIFSFISLDVGEIVLYSNSSKAREIYRVSESIV